MARAALNLSLDQLADLSGVSEKTIRRCEAVDGHPPVNRNSLERIRKAFEERGIGFINDGSIGPAVYLNWHPGFNVPDVDRSKPDPQGS